MLNGWYVYGGRRTFDTETFPLEYKKIRNMAAVRDRYVWDIAQGKTVSAAPDDSKTGELFTPPTGLGRHYPRSEPKELRYLSGEEALKEMEPAPGFEVSLFADEKMFPELAKPVQINFDNKGRLWVACMPTYPQWKPGDPKASDRLLIFEDTNNDGRRQVQGLLRPAALLDQLRVLEWRGARRQPARILFLKDTDGDDRADEVVLVGRTGHRRHASSGVSSFEWRPAPSPRRRLDVDYIRNTLGTLPQQEHARGLCDRPALAEDSPLRHSRIRQRLVLRLRFVGPGHRGRWHRRATTVGLAALGC
jgi:hypothetical protein